MRKSGLGQQPAAYRQEASSELTDEALAELSRAEPRAFGILFDRYWDTIFRFCYFRLRDWHEAEDVASQVFTNAFSSIGRFETHGPSQTFRSWLFGIARNVLGNSWRYSSRHQSTPIDSLHNLSDRAEPLDEQIVTFEQQALLLSLMSQLPLDQRELLELRLAGLSATEIGQVLARSPEAVRKAQSRIFAAMRASIGEPTSQGNEARHD